MKNFNNEIQIRRGETFTIDKFVENKDGSPYIVSNKLSNPYFVITIASSKFEQANRYIKKYWLSLANYPKFLSTQPVDLHSIKVSSSSTEIKYDDFPVDGLIEGYVDGVYVQYDRFDDAVFYIDKGDAVEYKYYNTEVDKTGTPVGWTTYKCRIIKSFSSADTSEWSEQEYIYSIDLISLPKPVTEINDEFEVKMPILKPTKLKILTSI